MAGSVYSSQSDLNLDDARLVELTDNASAPGVVDQSVLDSTSFDAQDQIDTELEGVYVVPFPADKVPNAIRRIHSAIWKYLLEAHRDVQDIPAAVQKERDEAIAKLADYGTPGDGGRVLLGAARVAAATGPSVTAGSFPADADDECPPRRVFGRAKDGLG